MKPAHLPDYSQKKIPNHPVLNLILPFGSNPGTGAGTNGIRLKRKLARRPLIGIETTAPAAVRRKRFIWEAAR
jgi:hypothetical protein